MSINQKLNETRIARGKEMLRSRESLTDIAKNSGFKTLSTFSRKSKEYENMSPLKYRNNLLKELQELEQ